MVGADAILPPRPTTTPATTYSTIASTASLPLHPLPFPHSPSPIPQLSPMPHTVASTQFQPATAGVPRFHRLEFATFDGKEDLLQWLNRCEQFFEGQRTMEEEKVWLASYHMTKIDWTWYTQL
jgi:hypothetical protein